MPRATKATPPKKAAPKKAVAKKVASVKKAPIAKKSVKAAAPVKKAVARRPAPTTPKVAPAPVKKAPPKKVVLDKFALEQRELLQSERARHVEQAQELKAEADQLAAEREPGDVQFDEESGEGGTTNIDRERDLALSMQAQVEVEEVDAALAKIEAGTYGICERCGQVIPKARLKAIPQARLCIACKSGGLSRR
jgi:DnaK suppressor protein